MSASTVGGVSVARGGARGGGLGLGERGLSMGGSANACLTSTSVEWRGGARGYSGYPSSRSSPFTCNIRSMQASNNNLRPFKSISYSHKMLKCFQKPYLFLYLSSRSLPLWLISHVIFAVLLDYCFGGFGGRGSEWSGRVLRKRTIVPVGKDALR